MYPFPYHTNPKSLVPWTNRCTLVHLEETVQSISLAVRPYHRHDQTKITYKYETCKPILIILSIKKKTILIIHQLSY